jgi:hypothetical protein
MKKIKKVAYTSTHDVNYTYETVSLEQIGKEVLKLRKQYPNNQDFGNAIETFLLKYKI